MRIEHELIVTGAPRQRAGLVKWLKKLPQKAELLELEIAYARADRRGNVEDREALAGINRDWIEEHGGERRWWVFISAKTKLMSKEREEKEKQEATDAEEFARMLGELAAREGEEEDTEQTEPEPTLVIGRFVEPQPEDIATLEDRVLRLVNEADGQRVREALRSTIDTIRDYAEHVGGERLLRADLADIERILTE